MVQEMFYLLNHVVCQPDVGGSLVIRSFLFYLCFLSNGAVLVVHLDCDLTVLHSLNDIKALYHTPVNR